MASIGAYFQCHKSPYATYKSLESFRNVYKTEPVVLLSSNGYNYEKMAKHFNCEYIHSYEGISFIQELTTDYKQNAKKLIERVVSAFKILDCKYIIWLEDDVYVHKRVPADMMYDINGYAPNIFRRDTIEKLSNFGLNVNRNYRFTGHGGSVYKCDAFINAMKNTSLIDYILDNWTSLSLPVNVCHDLLFSLLIICNGGTTGPYNGHIDYNELNSSCIIQHQYKKYYNISMPSELADLVTII
jgi:hypothetical protein